MQDMNRVYSTFRIHGLLEKYMDTSTKQVILHLKLSIEQQVRELQSVNVQLCMWVNYKSNLSCILILIFLSCNWQVEVLKLN